MLLNAMFDAVDPNLRSIITLEISKKRVFLSIESKTALKELCLLIRFSHLIAAGDFKQFIIEYKYALTLDDATFKKNCWGSIFYTTFNTGVSPDKKAKVSCIKNKASVTIDNRSDFYDLIQSHKKYPLILYELFKSINKMENGWLLEVIEELEAGGQFNGMSVETLMTVVNDQPRPRRVIPRSTTSSPASSTTTSSAPRTKRPFPASLLKPKTVPATTAPLQSDTSLSDDSHNLPPLLPITQPVVHINNGETVGKNFFHQATIDHFGGNNGEKWLSFKARIQYVNNLKYEGKKVNFQNITSEIRFVNTAMK
jgi:hypothetical protein